MTFSLLQANYHRNLPTELLDYQLPHIHHQRLDCLILNTITTTTASHLLANIRKMSYSQITCQQ